MKFFCRINHVLNFTKLWSLHWLYVGDTLPEPMFASQQYFTIFRYTSLSSATASRLELLTYGLVFADMWAEKMPTEFHQTSWIAVETGLDWISLETSQSQFPDHFCGLSATEKSWLAEAHLIHFPIFCIGCDIVFNRQLKLLWSRTCLTTASLKQFQNVESYA